MLEAPHRLVFAAMLLAAVGPTLLLILVCARTGQWRWLFLNRQTKHAPPPSPIIVWLWRMQLLLFPVYLILLGWFVLEGLGEIP